MMHYIKSAITALCLLPIVGNAAVIYSYAISDRLSAGDPLNQDGWSSAGSNWIANSFNGELYARNDVGVSIVDRRIVRTNDTASAFQFQRAQPRSN